MVGFFLGQKSVGWPTFLICFCRNFGVLLVNSLCQSSCDNWAVTGGLARSTKPYQFVLLVCWFFNFFPLVFDLLLFIFLIFRTFLLCRVIVDIPCRQSLAMLFGALIDKVFKIPLFFPFFFPVFGSSRNFKNYAIVHASCIWISYGFSLISKDQ